MHFAVVEKIASPYNFALSNELINSASNSHYLNLFHIQFCNCCNARNEIKQRLRHITRHRRLTRYIHKTLPKERSQSFKLDCTR